MDYMFIDEDDENSTGGFIIGIRAGYQLTPSKADWNLNNFDIIGGSEIGMKGPFVRFMIGGGGYSHNN